MALRDWVSGAVATATIATNATKPNPKSPSLAGVAAAEPRKSDPIPTGPRTTTVTGNKTTTAPRFTYAAIYQGEPTPAAIDLADEMLKHIADQQRPCAEAEIVEAVEGDAVMARNIMNRLAVDGIAEALPGGLFDIPPYPPRPANLPQGCPLRTGCLIPKGCRFEARLFQRMMAEGTLPLPGGSCPLRALCRVGSKK